MMGLRWHGGGTVSVLWAEALEGEERAIHDRLVGRLLSRSEGSNEVIFCIGDDRLIMQTRELPGLTDREAEQSVMLEMEYSGEECQWAHKYHDGVLTLKKLPLGDYGDLVEAYRGELTISGVMAVEYPEDTIDISDGEMPEVEWRTPVTGQLQGEYMALLYTASSYIRRRGCCFERVPDLFYRWNWLRIGALLLLVNVFVSLSIGIGGFLKCQEIDGKIHEYKQQLALLESVRDMKKDAEDMTGEIRSRARILASVRDKGTGLSGYAFMVKLSSAAGGGVTLTEARVEADKQIMLKGRAGNVGELVKYINGFGGEISIEKTQQGEKGDVEFVCRGQL
ncbi:hypothetical protein D081_1718 [Anaerovibrio sp. JC8]|uniref:hypothetical protein n=1 Tax=Anaerovibrio sp. JC8 TaxID=1240085 RepID=UPI000A0E3B21|nr:hypothetical protein [Anaerovibrio sp. JC8]ORT99568.1 hypothetical protein D081_1718 [Anaerovibrio sp. JC8]